MLPGGGRSFPTRERSRLKESNVLICVLRVFAFKLPVPQF